MAKFNITIEQLIDRFLLYLPAELFVEAPFLEALLADPNGRYVLSGVAVVTCLLFFWVLLSVFQLLFVNLFRNCESQKSKTSSVPIGQKTEWALGEFQFFRRKGTNNSSCNSNDALKLIEQEMLAIRQEFANGLVLKDIYVSETKRLYIKANKLKV